MLSTSYLYIVYYISNHLLFYNSFKLIVKFIFKKNMILCCKNKVSKYKYANKNDIEELELFLNKLPDENGMASFLSHITLFGNIVKN